MTELHRYEQATMLRDTIGHFMRRAQNRGCGVTRVGGVAGQLLTNGLLSEHIIDIDDGANLVFKPRVVVITPQQGLREGDFSVGLFGDKGLTSTMIAAAHVSIEKVIDRTDPTQTDAPLPQPNFELLTDTLQHADPRDVDRPAAEFLHHRVAGNLALGVGSFQNRLP